MKKIGLVVAMMALCVSAYAYTDEPQRKWKGAWDSVGGFIYNTLPWNWDNWLWKNSSSS